MAKKKRSTVDLPEDIWERLDKKALKLSYDRGQKISRNNLIEELLEDGLDRLDQLEKEQRSDEK